MTLKALCLGHNSTVVLYRLVRHDGIGLDSVHLTALGHHVPPLPASVLGHIDGQENV